MYVNSIIEWTFQLSSILCGKNEATVENSNCVRFKLWGKGGKHCFFLLREKISQNPERRPHSSTKKWRKITWLRYTFCSLQIVIGLHLKKANRGRLPSDISSLFSTRNASQIFIYLHRSSGEIFLCGISVGQTWDTEAIIIESEKANEQWKWWKSQVVSNCHQTIDKDLVKQAHANRLILNTHTHTHGVNKRYVSHNGILASYVIRRDRAAFHRARLACRCPCRCETYPPMIPCADWGWCAWNVSIPVWKGSIEISWENIFREDPTFKWELNVWNRPSRSPQSLQASWRGTI